MIAIDFETYSSAPLQKVGTHKWDVNEYIKHGKAAAINPAFIRQLENASARFHISKLDALKLKTRNTLEQLFGRTQTKTKSHLGMIYEEQYYRTVYDLQQGFNIGWDIAAVNKAQVESVLSKPWTLDGQTFSDRIWKQKNALLSEVHTRLTQNMILGSPPDEAIAAIARKFGTSKANAGRLVMTESAYFAAAAQKQAYETLGVEEYEIVATLDTHTSELCQSLDGKVFPMAQFQPGVTAPPFHPNCRTATAPYFADESGDRFARGADGKTYYVPGDMQYADWKAAYVDKTAPKGTPINVAPQATKMVAGGQNGGSGVIIKSKLAGVDIGTPMTFEEADAGRANPNYRKGGGYHINCQSCVVTNEARRRGYNVQTLPRTPGSVLEMLSHNTQDAWKNADGSIVSNSQHVRSRNVSNAKEALIWLNKNVKPNERYTLGFPWKRRRSGHIISVECMNLV